MTDTTSIDRLRRQIRDLVDLAALDDDLAWTYQAMLAERREALERLWLGLGSPQDGLGRGAAPNPTPTDHRRLAGPIPAAPAGAEKGPTAGARSGSYT